VRLCRFAAPYASFVRREFFQGGITLFLFDFQVANGDQNIGTVYLPHEHAANIPVIIFCHGWGGSRQLGPPEEAIRDRAMRSGYAFVAFDFYGCGETGGDYSLMTYTRWKENLSGVYSWCANQPFADSGKIGCYSVSSGTTAALRFGAENHSIAFIVSVATCISSHIGMHQGGPAKILADCASALFSGEKKELFGTSFGVDFFIDTVSNSPIHKLGDIQCPVLFLQGLNDNPFRCADAKMGYELMRRNDLPATYIEIPGGNHCLENVIDEAMSNMFGWLSAVIPSAPSRIP